MKNKMKYLLALTSSVITVSAYAFTTVGYGVVVQGSNEPIYTPPIYTSPIYESPVYTPPVTTYSYTYQTSPSYTYSYSYSSPNVISEPYYRPYYHSYTYRSYVEPVTPSIIFSYSYHDHHHHHH